MKDHSEHSTPALQSRAGHVRKAIFAVITAVCLIYSLSACDSKISEKTEDQISDDIQQQDIYFSTYNLNLDSFSVSKRQTNMEDKEDFVWCTISASNDMFSYSAEYELRYVLYNDGWLLEECAQNNPSVIPSSPPTQTQAEAERLVLEYEEQHLLDHVAETWVMLRSSLQKLSDVSYAYYFRTGGRNIYGYDTIPSDYAVYYQFDPASGWSSEVASVNLNWG